MSHTIDEPTLDGMPELPPAWVRPESGVRMSALGLEHMLAAALPHAGADENLPALMAISLEVADGQLTSRATDRYSVLRERRLVSQTCDAFHFLLRTEDAASLRVLLKTVLRGLKDDARDVEPVDLALEVTDDGPTLRILGQDLDVRFTQHDGVGDFPKVDAVIDRSLTALDANELEVFDAYINPTLLARVVPLQKAGRGAGLFLFRRPINVGPVIVTTFDEDDDVTVALMPVNAGTDA